MLAVDYDRRQSIDCAYYGEPSPEIARFERSMSVEFRHLCVDQSPALPHWLWVILAKCLGIKRRIDEKPIFGTFMYASTLTAAILYTAVNSYYVAYDIASEFTSQEMMTGCVDIIIGFMWCAIAVYSNNLCSSLFSHRKFLDSVRMHTKKVFRVNAALVLTVFTLCCASIHMFYHFDQIYPASCCSKVKVPHWVCPLRYISRAVICAFGIFWNLLVGLVMLSVSRTHTIGDDWDDEYNPWCPLPTLNDIPTTTSQQTLTTTITAEPNESISRSLAHKQSVLSSSSNSAVPGGCQGNTSSNAVIGATCNVQVPTPVKLKDFTGDGNCISDQSSSQSPFSDDVLAQHIISTEGQTNQQVLPDNDANSQKAADKNSENPPCEGPTNDVFFQATVNDDDDNDSYVSLCCEEILLSYWKISRRFQSTSTALQRWLSVCITFILLFCAKYIAFWFSTNPDWWQIVIFTSAIAILPLLCSAFGEVNAEATRVVRAIYPLRERRELVSHLASQPLQLTLYGIPLTYGKVVGIILMLSVAMCSRIISTEMMK